MPLCHVRAIQIRAHAESSTRRREGSLAPPSSVPLVLLRLYLARSGGGKVGDPEELTKVSAWRTGLS